MKLLLIRHGQTLANSHGLTQGSGNEEPLSATGNQQAEAVANRLLEYHIDRIFSSPTKRAIETSTAIANKFGIPVEIVVELTERDWGQWNTQSWSETQQKLAVLSLAEKVSFIPPGGESENQIAERLKRAIEMLEEKPSDGIVIVTHIAILNVLIPLLLDEPLTHKTDHSLPNTSITILERTQGNFKLLTLGDASHLV